MGTSGKSDIVMMCIRTKLLHEPDTSIQWSRVL